MANATMGHRKRIGVGAAGSASTKQLFFLSCDLGKKGQHLNSENEGWGGTQEIAENVAEGQDDVSGQLVLEPRPDELAVLLPFIFGTTDGSGTVTHSFAANPPLMVVDFDKVFDIYRYDNVVVARATFASSPNQKLRVTLDLVGRTEVGGTTFPTIASTLSTRTPYVHHQLVESINSVEYKVNEVEVVVDWNIDRDHYNNSKTRQEQPTGGITVAHNINTRFTTDEAALYDIAVAGLASGSSKWTSGGDSLEFLYGLLQAPTQSPGMTGKRAESRLAVQFAARRKLTPTAVDALRAVNTVAT